MQGYAEAARAARDLVKLAKLTQQTVEVSVKEKGKPRSTEVKSYQETGSLSSPQEYADRAIQEILVPKQHLHPATTAPTATP